MSVLTWSWLWLRRCHTCGDTFNISVRLLARVMYVCIHINVYMVNMHVYVRMYVCTCMCVCVLFVYVCACVVSEKKIQGGCVQIMKQECVCETVFALNSRGIAVARDNQ